MKKAVFVLLPLLFVLFSCDKKPEAETGRIEIPELGISIVIPDTMQSITAEQLAQLQEEAAGFPPIPPFSDYPVREFIDPAANAVLVVSQLNFTGLQTEAQGPVDIRDTYLENLKVYYQLDSIVTQDLVKDDFQLTVMNMIYAPEGQEEIGMTKVLYYYYPRHYFLIDLFTDPGKVTTEDAESYRNMLMSVKKLTGVYP
ncbi:MAG: hypothetical protein LBE10_11035 [Treponema sp.]|nr:hypothetical protein [Treponema sp.]